jgi:hypothetical protein
MVLALLGDNPMQSEFACHIGLKGKFFCRACWVKGTDASAEAGQEHTGSPRASSRGGSSEETSENGSTAGSERLEATDSEIPQEARDTGKKTKWRRKKGAESMSNMVNRVKAFVKARLN